RCSSCSQYSCRTCTMSVGQGEGAGGSGARSGSGSAAALVTADTGPALGATAGAEAVSGGSETGASTVGLAAEQPATAASQSEAETRGMPASTPARSWQANSRRLRRPRRSAGWLWRRVRLGRVEHEVWQHALQAAHADAAHSEQVAGLPEALQTLAQLHDGFGASGSDARQLGQHLGARHVQDDLAVAGQPLARLLLLVAQRARLPTSRPKP